MKKQYTEPEMEVIGLGREDIILTSGELDCEEGYLCDEGCTNPGVEVADEG